MRQSFRVWRLVSFLGLRFEVHLFGFGATRDHFRFPCLFHVLGSGVGFISSRFGRR